MPSFDSTGPLGQGPRTGRGLGPCNSIRLAPIRRVVPNPARGLGRGLGPGGGRGYGRFNQSRYSTGQPGQFFIYGPPK